MKEHLIGTKATNSIAMQLTKLISYGAFGALNQEVFCYGILLGVGAIIGVFLARQHLSNIEVEHFHQYSLILMFTCGVAILLKAF